MSSTIVDTLAWVIKQLPVDGSGTTQILGASFSGTSLAVEGGHTRVQVAINSPAGSGDFDRSAFADTDRLLDYLTVLVGLDANGNAVCGACFLVLPKTGVAAASFAVMNGQAVPVGFQGLESTNHQSQECLWEWGVHNGMAPGRVQVGVTFVPYIYPSAVDTTKITRVMVLAKTAQSALSRSWSAPAIAYPNLLSNVSNAVSALPTAARWSLWIFVILCVVGFIINLWLLIKNHRLRKQLAQCVGSSPPPPPPMANVGGVPTRNI